MLRVTTAVAAVAVLLGACNSTQTLLPKAVAIERPAQGETVVAGLGDVVLEWARSNRYDGIWLENELTWLDLYRFRRFAIGPGRLIAKEADADFVYYFSDQVTYRDPVLGAEAAVSGGICVRKSDPDQVRVFVAKGVCGIMPDQRPRFTPVSVAQVAARNDRRELIYGGRSGSVLRFVYRELKDDQPNPTLSLEFHIDLSDGPSFGLRGAQIEVVEATNSKLTYRVISSFAETAR